MDDRNISQPHTHLIWDADGSPDSVVALLYYLRNPNITVDACTISCGEARPAIFARNLVRMLAQLGHQDIPVAAGRAIPLEGDNAFPPPLREPTDVFWGIELPETEACVHPLPAAELIVEMLNTSPSPVAVHVSGSHTNLAEALRLDPQIKDKIAFVQVMGGALYVPGNIGSEWPGIRNEVAEWNIWVDSVAASEVFSAGLSLHLTPLDATNQVIWTSQDADAWAASGTPEGKLAAEILRWFLGLVEEFFPGAEGYYWWDVVTAVNVTDPQLCEQERVHVQVITEPGDQQGRTIVVGDQPANTVAFLKPQGDQIKQLVARAFASGCQ